MTTSRFPTSPSIYASPAQGKNSGSLSHNSLLDGSWGAGSWGLLSCIPDTYI